MWDENLVVPNKDWFIIKVTKLLKDPANNQSNLGFGLFLKRGKRLEERQRILRFIGTEISAHYPGPKTAAQCEYSVSLSLNCYRGCRKKSCKVLQCREQAKANICWMSLANTANHVYRLNADGKTFTRLSSSDNNSHAVISPDGSEIWGITTRVIDAIDDDIEILWPYGQGYIFV
jgi:hypothetical protein